MVADSLVELAQKIWAAGSPTMDLPSRIASSIGEKIKSGELPVGFKFPAEAILAKQIRVSRPTLREAIRILAQEGALDVKHGVGTFVARRRAPLHDQLETQQSLSALLRAAGMVPSFCDLSIELVTAPPAVSEQLCVDPERPVALVSRTRLADGIPLAVNYEYLVKDTPQADFELMSRFDGSSIYTFLSENLGLHLIESRVVIGAVAADADHARKLNVKKGGPLLLLRQIQFDEAGKPVLYTMSYQNSEIIEFTSIRLGRRV